MKIKQLRDNAIVPTKGSNYSAGWDLYAAPEDKNDIEIRAAGTALIGTGWAMEIPAGYFGAIFARSGLATKQGLRPANCVGVIDSDYRGEVKVALHNDSGNTCIVPNGLRIAQLVLIPYSCIENLEVAEELDDTERGEGGFGSTGYK